MSKELFISTTPHETKLAIVENEEVTEIYFERENEYTLAGSIYKGKVTRVLPGMQSAFVDVGLERDAFLYVTDFMDMEDQEDDDLDHVVVKPAGEERRERGGDRTERSERPERNDRSDRNDRGDRQRGGRGQRQSQRELSRSAAPNREALIEADFSEPVEAQPQRHRGQVIPETETNGDGGARRYEGRKRRRRGGREEAAEPQARVEAEQETHEPQERQDRPKRGGQASPAAFVLPGEALQKYGAQPEGDARDKKRSAPKPSFRPSTEVDLDNIEGFDGFALPGEKLSKRETKVELWADEDEDAAAVAPEVQVQQEQGSGELWADDEDAEPQVQRTVSEETHDEEPEGDRSASHRTDPDIMKFIFRKRNSGSIESEATETVTTESPEAEREVAENERAQAGVLPSEYAPHDVAETQNGASADTAEATTETEAHPHTFAPGEGHVEEVEEEYQDDEVEGIGAAEYAEDEFSMEELEEETLSGDLDERYAAIARSAAADQIVEETEEEGEDTKPDLTGVFAEADFTGGEEEEEPVGGDPPQRRERKQRGGMIRGRRNVQKQSLPTISDLLKEGQEVLVQIAKEPIAKKGARITSHIALPGRFLVFMPTVGHVGVSRKIGSDEERLRLKRILLSEKGEAHGGFIVRTAAAGASEDDLRADIRFLINLWNEIKSRSDNSKPPALIYHDLNLVERVLRDQVTSSFSAIWVDSEIEYERIVRFLSRFQPAMVKRVKLYTKEMPLFEQFGIQDEINKALKSKVWLKSGGYIVINQTEALVAIDINTGKYVGKTTRLEDTIVKTNIDAIQEIVRQIRLRDLGGIIVIDFIDMDERRNRQKVMQALEEALKQDRAPSKVLQFNDFGLVAITRKRVKQSLERTLGSTCNYCQGTGFVKSPATVCNEIYVEMRKMAKHFERHDVMLRVNPEVVKALKANTARWLQDMEELTGKTIIVKSDPTLHQEQFDIH